MFTTYSYTVVDRFLSYARIDTQSNEASTDLPSSPGQMTLLRMLVEEMQDLGLHDVHLHQNAMAVGTLRSNLKKTIKTPTVAFIAHVDTTPQVTGRNVQPLLHTNYQGGDIHLPGNKKAIISPHTNPELKEMIGYDIITSDGTTLLGTDDKAGIAEIMDALHFLTQNPDIQHGDIMVCFLPDEEVGLRGAARLDYKALGIDYAYTLDGKEPGSIKTANFNADLLVIRFLGINVHPGDAKGKLVNPLKVAARAIEKLPPDHLSPETTQDEEGYIYPYAIQSKEDNGVEVTFVMRDFDEKQLQKHEDYVIKLAEEAVAEFPGATMEYHVVEQYRNMQYTLDKHPQAVKKAQQAIRRIGLIPTLSSIRGGTDGSALSYRGLPTPNLFSGQRNIHSVTEWIAVQDMHKAVQMVVYLCEEWGKRE